MVVGGWVLDFTKLMQSHLLTKVEVEVEDELGNFIKGQLFFIKFFVGINPFQLGSRSD